MALKVSSNSGRAFCSTVFSVIPELVGDLAASHMSEMASTATAAKNANSWWLSCRERTTEVTCAIRRSSVSWRCDNVCVITCRGTAAAGLRYGRRNFSSAERSLALVIERTWGKRVACAW